MIKESDFIKVEDRMPEDGQIVAATSLYRFKHYKKNSQQYKRGIIGRWQSLNECGFWNNCGDIVGSWIPAERLEE